MFRELATTHAPIRARTARGSGGMDGGGRRFSWEVACLWRTGTSSAFSAAKKSTWGDTRDLSPLPPPCTVFDHLTPRMSCSLLHFSPEGELLRRTYRSFQGIEHDHIDWTRTELIVSLNGVQVGRRGRNYSAQ